MSFLLVPKLVTLYDLERRIKWPLLCVVLAYLPSNVLNEVDSLFWYFEVGLRGTWSCAISSLKSSRLLSHLLMSSCGHMEDYISETV